MSADHTPPARLPLWIASIYEAIWHHPISAGLTPRTACGKTLRAPVHGARSPMPPGTNPPLVHMGRDQRTPPRRSICSQCAEASELDPFSDRITVRAQVLHDALLRYEDQTPTPQPKSEPEPIVWPPHHPSSTFAAAA